MKAVLQTASREISRLKKDRKLLILLFIWPFVFAVFLAGVYSAKVIKKMPIAVCDLDNSSMSRLALRYLNATRSLNIAERAPNAEALKKLITEAKVEAGIYIPRGFMANIKKTKKAEIIAFANGGNMIIGNMVLSDVKTVAGTMSAGARIKYLEKTGSSHEQAYATFAPVSTENFRLFNPGGNYQRFLSPALWGTMLQQILLTLGALLLVSEKENKTYEQAAAAANKSNFALILGKFIPYALLCYLVLELMQFIMYPIFSIPLKNQFAAAISNLCFTLAVLSLGIMISSFVKEEVDALKGVLTVGAPALILCGYIWPVAYMPHWLRIIPPFIPLTPYLAALRPVEEYGASIFAVSNHLLHLLLLSVLYLFVVWLKLNLERRHA